KALQQLATKLNITQWKVNSSSCPPGQGLSATHGSSISIVDCNCTFNNNTICHVTKIELKSFNLQGELPVEFANLPYLRMLDLTRNYLNGNIPRAWATLPLVTLSLLGNLVTGTIPKEIGDIRTLEDLNFQDNRMEGPIPKELGNLINLKRILLGGNDYTGVLPDSLGNLKNLIDFRIDGASFSGKIPEFIGNWTKLERLDMQGTSMEGPIPSTISLLTNLRELRITDLRASNISFPDLRDLNKLTDLVLRNCSITGRIPQYIGQSLTNIKNLDLSFNRLKGPVRDNLGSLRQLNFMYLTSNSLTGPVSQWLSVSKENIDISYNNFTGSSQSNNCQANYLKKIAIYSSPEDKSIDWCLKKDLPCTTKSSQYELFINCGGPKSSLHGKQYKQDTRGMGPSEFFSNEKWACSTTGDFLGDEKAGYRKTSTTGKPDDIYSSARLAPFSLRYYGRCLIQGSYTVKLHFAEIVLTADPTNNTRGWGKRIFDIYIQGDRVLSDFNIAEEAGGIGKGIEKEYKANVTGNTLEIHLYWSGKGTAALPVVGVYGPLISAISVTP
ncbi:Leucine-rich repeat receptor protein kinase msp1, partial [Thalictrum thalictroides]